MGRITHCGRVYGGKNGVWLKRQLNPPFTLQQSSPQESPSQQEQELGEQGAVSLTVNDTTNDFSYRKSPESKSNHNHGNHETHNNTNINTNTVTTTIPKTTTIQEKAVFVIGWDDVLCRPIYNTNDDNNNNNNNDGDATHANVTPPSTTTPSTEHEHEDKHEHEHEYDWSDEMEEEEQDDHKNNKDNKSQNALELEWIATLERKRRRTRKSPYGSHNHRQNENHNNNHTQYYQTLSNHTTATITNPTLEYWDDTKDNEPISPLTTPKLLAQDEIPSLANLTHSITKLSASFDLEEEHEHEHEHETNDNEQAENNHSSDTEPDRISPPSQSQSSIPPPQRKTTRSRNPPKKSRTRSKKEPISCITSTSIRTTTQPSSHTSLSAAKAFFDHLDSHHALCINPISASVSELEKQHDHHHQNHVPHPESRNVNISHLDVDVNVDVDVNINVHDVHATGNKSQRTIRIPNIHSKTILEEYQHYVQSTQGCGVTPLTIIEYVNQRGVHFMHERGIEGLLEDDISLPDKMK